MGDMAALLTQGTPLNVLQEVLRCQTALYHLQALRSVATTDVTTIALDTAGVLGERTHHLRAISFHFVQLERDLAEARLRITALEARETHWVHLEAQWVNERADRLQTIIGLQEQRENMRGQLDQMQAQIDQLRDERLQHLQALTQMEEQVEILEDEVEAANNLIHVLQQPVPPVAPAEMEDDPDAMQGMSGMDSEGAAPQPAPMEPDSSASSASSVGNLDDF